MKLSVLDKPEDLLWLVERVGFAPTAHVRAVKCVDEAGRIVGMVAYDNWTENAVQAHMAVETPIAWRAMLPAVFQYPFVDYRRGVLIGIVSSENAKSLALTKHFGFRETHRIRDGLKPGVDLVIHEMRREDCRWLQPKPAASKAKHRASKPKAPSRREARKKKAA